VIASATIERRAFDLVAMHWPAVYTNAKALYREASNMGPFGRGEKLRSALEDTLRVAGMAAALQEILAFVESQTYASYGSDPASASGQPVVHDGFESWNQVADGYLEYLRVLIAAEGWALRETMDTNWRPFRAFLKPVYAQSKGFPMLPGV